MFFIGSFIESLTDSAYACMHMLIGGHTYNQPAASAHTVINVSNYSTRKLRNICSNDGQSCPTPPDSLGHSWQQKQDEKCCFGEGGGVLVVCEGKHSSFKLHYHTAVWTCLHETVKILVIE